MAKITQLDDAGIKFLIEQEGLRLKPYKDSKGIPTIAVGSTFYEDGRSVKMTDPPITKERAMQLFKNVRARFEKAVAESVTSNINQNQFNALVSICYNIGIGQEGPTPKGFKGSTLLKRVNANPNDPSITEAFKMWRKPPELLPRRIRESNLYFKT
jgi:lysozyme